MDVAEEDYAFQKGMDRGVMLRMASGDINGDQEQEEENVLWKQRDEWFNRVRRELGLPEKTFIYD